MKKTADQQEQKQELLQTDWLISMAWEFESMKTDKNKPAWKVQKKLNLGRKPRKN